MTEPEWASLTAAEKRRRRFDAWLNPQSVDFVSPEAAEAYKKRAKRFIDAYNITRPDRVPVSLMVGNLPLDLYGISYHEAIYDPARAVQACSSFNEKYSGDLEAFFVPDLIRARALDLFDYRLYVYPGHGLPKESKGFQFVEGEYMMADEYDALIRDPSDFWLRTYLPRVFGVFKPFHAFQSLTGLVELPILDLNPLTDPAVRNSLQALLDAGAEYSRAERLVSDYRRKGPAMGFPEITGLFCKAPFDVIGDTLRGSTGIMKDMYRQPEKLLRAMDVIAEYLISNTLEAAGSAEALSASFPLHKGADGWMSQKQFDTFYWPPLKKIIEAFAKEGLPVRLFAEGKFDTRLEAVNEFPEGAVCWWFDQTDMSRAKEVLGDRCCIQGNVPSSMLMTGAPEEVREYCRKLIETCGKGGGFILSPGAIVDSPRLENIMAMMEAVREFGVYT